LYSGVTRTPLYSAEHLTKARIEAAKGVRRHNAFHAEKRLPKADRSELRDYAKSGYDRGHMQNPVKSINLKCRAGFSLSMHTLRPYFLKG